MDSRHPCHPKEHLLERQCPTQTPHPPVTLALVYNTRLLLECGRCPSSSPSSTEAQHGVAIAPGFVSWHSLGRRSFRHPPHKRKYMGFCQTRSDGRFVDRFSRKTTTGSFRQHEGRKYCTSLGLFFQKDACMSCMRCKDKQIFGHSSSRIFPAISSLQTFTTNL